MNVGVPLFNKTSQGHLRATGLQPTQIENDFIYLNSYEEFHNNPIPGTSQETQPQEPSLVFAVQPPDKYRFRYLSENGSHGQLKTNSVFPKVELKNFHKPGPVEIKVEIYTWDPDPKKRQPHRILQFKQRKGLKSSISYTCYKRKGCFHTELKGVRIMKLTKSDLQKEHKMTYEAAEAAWSQDRDLPGCLRVEASYQNNVIGTIYSNTITTLLPSSLRIHNVFPKHLRAREELCILTDLVKKNDIEVFLMNEDTHNELMCPIKTYHHRFTIVCKIPEIRNQDNTNPVQLKLYLQRPSDNTMSNYYEVTYTNDYYLPRKRKRASLQGPEDWDVCSDLTPLQSQQQCPIQQQQQHQQYDPQLQQQWHWDQSVCQQQHHPHESSQSQLQHEQQLMPIVQQVPNYLVPHQQNPAVPQQSQNQQVSPIPNHVQVPGNQESPSNYFSFSDESGQSQSSFSNSAPAGHLLNMGLTQHGEVQSHTGQGQFPEGLGNKMDCTTNDKYDNNFSGQQNHPIRSLDNTYMSNSDSNARYSYGPLIDNNSQYETIYDDSFGRDYEYDSCSNEDDSRPNNTRRSQDAPLPKDFRDEEEENKANQGIQTSNTLDVDETTQFEEDDKQKAYRFGEMDQLIKGTEHINIKRETEVRDTATNTSYYTGSIPNGRFNEKDSQYADHAERTHRSAEKTDQSESIEEEGKQNRPLLIGVNISKKDPKQRNDSNSNTTGNPEQDKDKSYDNGGEKNFERLLANAEPDSEIISTGNSQKSLDTGLYEKHPSGADIKEKNLYSTEGNIKMNNHFARRVRNNTKDATRKEASTVQDYNNPGDKTENDEQSSRISETEVQQSLESQNKSENSEQNNSEFIYKVQMTTQVKNKSDRQGEETTEDGEGGKEEEVQEEFGDEKEKMAEEKQEVEEEEEGEDEKEDDVLIDKETPNETLICLGAAVTKVRKLVKGNGTNKQRRGEAPGKRTVSVERDDSSYQGRETLKEMIFPTIKRYRQLMRRETELIQREREILEIEIQLVKRERELEERAKQLTEVREKSQKKINLREGKHGTHQSLKSKGTQFSNTQKKSTTMKANTNDIKGKGDLTIKDENSKLWHAATSLDGKGKEEDVFTKEKLNISKRQCSLNIGKGNERETANGDGEMDNRTLLQEMTGITEETDMLNLNISIKQKVKLEKISEERTQKREENDRRFENENITKTKDNDGEKEEIPTSGCIQRVPEKRKEINENKMGIVIKEDEFLDDKDVIQNVDLGEGEIIKRHNREMDIEQQLCSEKENVQVAETDEAKGRVRVQEMDRILGRDLIITEDKDTNFESGEVNNENEDTCKGKKVKDGKSLVESEKETVLYITEIIEEHHIRREDEATGIMETLKLTIKNEATDEEKREEPAYRREVNAVVGQENVTTKQVKQTTDGQEEDVLIRQEEKATVRQEIFITGQKRESYPKQGEINTEQEKETITGQDGNVIKGQDEEATAEYEGITIAEKEELPTVWQEKAVDRLGDDATTGQKKDAINEQEDGTVYKHEGNVTDTQEEEIAKQEVETVDEDREEACAGHEEAATAGLENITIIGSEKKTSSEQEGTVAEREEVTLSENQFTTFLTGGDAITVQKEELFNGLEETTTPLKREANVGQKERTIVEMQGVTVRKEGSKTTEHGIEPTDGLEETRGWKKDEAEATADQEEKYARQGPSATTSQEDSSDLQKEKTRTGKEETNTGENEKTIEGQMEDTGQEEDAIIREESVEIPEQEENAITGVGKETTFGKRAATAGWEAEGIAGQGEDPITLKKEKAITGQGEYRLTCRGAEETVWQEDGITLQKEKAIAGQEDHRFTCRGEETAWQEEDAITFQRAKAIAGQGDHWFTCRRKEETAGQEEDAITLQKEKSTAGQGEPRVTCRGEEETAVTGQGEYSMFTWRNEEENAGQEGHTITTREEDAIAAPDEATTGQEQNLFIRQEAEAPAEQKGTPYGQADTTNIWEEEASARKEAVTKKEEYLVIEQEEAKPIWLKEEATTGQVKNKSMIPEDEAITKQEKATTGQEDVFIELEKEATTELQKEIISGREYSTAGHKEKVLTTLNEKNITGQVENATVSQEDKLTIVQIETGGKLEEAGKEVTVGQEADTVNEHIKANNQERNSLMAGVVSKTETTNMKGKLTEKQTKLVEKLAEDFYPDMRQQEMNSTVEPSDTEYETAYECQNKCNNTPQENERHMHYINAQLQKQHTKKAETKPANKRDRRSSCRARNVTDDVCKSTSDEGDCKNSIREQSIKEVTNAESNNVNKDGKSKTVSGRTDKDLFNKTYKECNDYSGSKCSSREKRFRVNCGSSLEGEKSDENSESSIKIEIDGNNENSPADETSDENSAEDERSDENSPADETSDKNSSEDEISDENSSTDETSDENSAEDETFDEYSSEDETSDENSAEDETSHENNENSEIIESSTEEAVDGHHESSNEQETDVGEEIVKEKYGVIVDNEGEVEKRRNKRARETRRTNTSSKRTGDDNLQDTSSEADFNASSHRRALTTTELGPSGAEAGGNTMKQDQNRKSTKPRGSPAQPTTPAEMAPRNPSSSDGRGSGEIPCTTEKGKRRTDFEAKETKNSAKNERGNVTRDVRDERSRTSRDCHDRSPVKEEDSTRPINNTKGRGQRQKHKNNGDISVKDKSTKRMKGRKKCTQDNKENAKEVPEQEDVNNRWLCTMS